MLKYLNVLINNHGQQITTGNSFLLHTHSHQQSLITYTGSTCMHYSRTRSEQKLTKGTDSGSLNSTYAIPLNLLVLLHVINLTSRTCNINTLHTTKNQHNHLQCTLWSDTTFCMIVQCQEKCKSGLCLRNMSENTITVKAPNILELLTISLLFAAFNFLAAIMSCLISWLLTY